MKNLSIEVVKESFKMLTMLENKKFSSVVKLARTLHCEPTKLVAFILDNPKLFHTSNRWEPKKKKVPVIIGGKKIYEEIEVRGKSIGLCIDAVFLDPSENYLNQEWLEVMLVKNRKYLHVSEADNYGHIQGYYFCIDKPDDAYRTHIWRNTQEKIDNIKEYLKKQTFLYGGLGDSFSSTQKYAITSENLEKLKEQGWTFNDYKKLPNE